MKLVSLKALYACLSSRVPVAVQRRLLGMLNVAHYLAYRIAQNFRRTKISLNLFSPTKRDAHQEVVGGAVE